MENVALKVLHFCYSGHPQPGIISQLEAEWAAAKKLNLDWHVAYFTHGKHSAPFVYDTEAQISPNAFFAKHKLYALLRVRALIWLWRNRKYYDVVLLRYMAGDPFILIYSLVCNKFITVHHSKEESEVSLKKGLGRRLGLLIERLMSRLVVQRAIGVVAVTGEILAYELSRLKRIKPGFVFPNGIITCQTESLIDAREGMLKLVFVGSRDYPWNGLDVIYQAVECNPDIPFELHLVGELAQECKDERLVYHGNLEKIQLGKLFQRMDLGLGTFGLYRKHMKEACTLKSREYLANGLPVVADHKDSALPKEFPFFTESGFELVDILKVAADARKVSKQQVFNEAERFINKAEWLQRLVHWIGMLNEPRTRGSDD